MTYATLAFGRVKYTVFVVAGEQRETFERHEAEQYFIQEIRQPWQSHRNAESKRMEAEKAFRNRTTIRSWWDIKGSTGGLFKPSRPAEPIDEVTLDGQVFQVEAGKAQDFINAEASRRFPAIVPPSTEEAWNFESWYEGTKREVRQWRAELISLNGASEISLGEILRPDWGFPISEALRELDRLEKQGWRIVHVSEDHGLYAGADVPDEAYLTRVRYLLHNSGC